MTAKTELSTSKRRKRAEVQLPLLTNSATNCAEAQTSTLAKLAPPQAIPPAAIGRAMAFAIEHPAEVDVNEIVIRPTAHG
jgi:NADP-dependent 3-hydroxy acid dehydrogenase YdfG